MRATFIFSYFFSLFAILFLAVLMSDYFKCHEKCGRTFSAAGGLTRHRQSCSHWQQQQDQQSLRFKRASTVTQGASAAKKLKFGNARVSPSDYLCHLRFLKNASLPKHLLMQLSLPAALRPLSMATKTLGK
jgi:hypothetical protein